MVDSYVSEGIIFFAICIEIDILSICAPTKNFIELIFYAFFEKML